MSSVESSPFDLHPETQAYFKFLQNEMGLKPDGEIDVVSDPLGALQKWRILIETIQSKVKSLCGSPEYDGERTEIQVPSKEVAGGIPVYLYRPRSLPSDPTVLVYFHGGGCTMGSREMVDDTCKILSNNLGCIVVNAEYRLAPEHKFPAMMDDGELVVRWVIENRATIGGTAKSKVGVSGDSSGGQIAASVTHAIGSSDLSFQILIYPLLSGIVRDVPSHKEFKGRPFGFTDEEIKWHASLVLEKEDDNRNPRYAILENTKHDHLPPTLLIVAEYDFIRDESYEYSKKLTDAGIENEVFLSKGAIHGYFTQPGFFVELSRDSYAKVTEFVNKVTHHHHT